MKLALTILIVLITLDTYPMAAGAKINRLDNLSIIIPSTDIYSELWEPNLELFFKNWPELLGQDKNVQIYLISNFKDFANPRVQVFKVGQEKSWSDNLLMLLDKIDTEYVLIWLDDYIITQPVDRARLLEITNFIKMKNAAYVGLTLGQSPEDGMVEPGIKGLISRNKFGPYRTSLQTCIWNKKALQWLLKPGESPWDFENQGTLRSQGMMAPFYTVTSGPVFTHLNAVNKGNYDHGTVEYINKQGIIFQPTKINVKKAGYLDKLKKWYYKKQRTLCKHVDRYG